MKKSLSLLVLLGISAAACCVAGAQPEKNLSHRWLYLNSHFHSDKDLDVTLDLIRTAAQHGLNGIVLPGTDHLSLASPEYLARLAKVKEVADANHMEVIPEGFGIKYGGAAPKDRQESR